MAGRFYLWTFLLVLSSTLLNFSASLPVRRERSTGQNGLRKYIHDSKRALRWILNQEVRLTKS